jgi:preprotein translocase subunit SecY
MGVVTGMDVVVILMVLFAVVWIFVQFYLPQAQKIDNSTPPPGTKKYVVMH